MRTPSTAPVPVRSHIRHRLLILGGTAEAAALAAALASRFGEDLDVTTSLAGRLATRPHLPGGLRVGGFGGAAGLAQYLSAEAIDLLIDATHPFAARISRHAAEACAAKAVPRLMLVRPPWQPADGDRWIEVADAANAAQRLPGLGRSAFLTTGAGEIPAFAGLSGVRFLVRLFASATGPLPLANYEVIVERPPFTVEGETHALRRHCIEVLVTKNSGGGATEAKLTAARALGLPVLIIRRPPLPEGERVAGVADAIAWTEAALAQLSEHPPRGRNT